MANDRDGIVKSIVHSVHRVDGTDARLVLTSRKLGTLHVDGWKRVTEAIKRNIEIEALLLGDNDLTRISDECWEMLSDAITCNEKITRIGLGTNRLSMLSLGACRHLANAIGHGNLRDINLLNNDVARLPAKHWSILTQAIKDNTNIQVLNLSGNDMSALFEGNDLQRWELLVEAIKSSTTGGIDELRFMDCNMGSLPVGAWEMFTAVLARCKYLDLSYNPSLSLMPLQAWREVATAIERNQQLGTLRLQFCNLGFNTLTKGVKVDVRMGKEAAPRHGTITADQTYDNRKSSTAKIGHGIYTVKFKGGSTQRVKSGSIIPVLAVGDRVATTRDNEGSTLFEATVVAMRTGSTVEVKFADGGARCMVEKSKLKPISEAVWRELGPGLARCKALEKLLLEQE